MSGRASSWPAAGAGQGVLGVLALWRCLLQVTPAVKPLLGLQDPPLTLKLCRSPGVRVTPLRLGLHCSVLKTARAETIGNLSGSFSASEIQRASQGLRTQPSSPSLAALGLRSPARCSQGHRFSSRQWGPTSFAPLWSVPGIGKSGELVCCCFQKHTRTSETHG